MKKLVVLAVLGLAACGGAKAATPAPAASTTLPQSDPIPTTVPFQRCDPGTHHSAGGCAPDPTITTVTPTTTAKAGLSRETRLAATKCIDAVKASISRDLYNANCGDAMDQADVDGDQTLHAMLKSGYDLAASMRISMSLGTGMSQADAQKWLGDEATWEAQIKTYIG